MQRFDANSYLYLTRMMDYFDLEEGFGSLAEALDQSRCRFFVASYDTDWLFPTSQSRELVSGAAEDQATREFSGAALSVRARLVLIDLPPLAGLVGPFLDRTFAAG